MNALDTPPPPSPTPFWNTSLRYGAYCGGVFVATSILTYLLSLDMMSLTSIVLLYGSILVIGSVFATMAARHQRDELDGGYITFGKALLVGGLTVFVGMLISGVWNYLLVTVIDPDYMATLKEQFIDTWGESMPEENLKEALKGFDNASDFGQSIKSTVIGGLIFGVIIGLIGAAFSKKQPQQYMN